MKLLTCISGHIDGNGNQASLFLWWKLNNKWHFHTSCKVTTYECVITKLIIMAVSYLPGHDFQCDCDEGLFSFCTAVCQTSEPLHIFILFQIRESRSHVAGSFMLSVFFGWAKGSCMVFSEICTAVIIKTWGQFSLLRVFSGRNCASAQDVAAFPTNIVLTV